LFAHETSVFAFPNPATEAIQIKFNKEGVATEEIKIVFIDMLGRIMNVTKQIGTSDLIYDVSHLSQGVYSVNLTYEGKTRVVKFVKQ
jgi:hypothetical protein